MNISTWAIRNPTPSILLFFMLTVAGLIAFRGLGIQGFPDVDFPTVMVEARLPGAPPASWRTRSRAPSRTPSPASTGSTTSPAASPTAR